MINVSPAISRLAKTATLSAVASGTYDEGGNFVPGADTETEIKAVILEMNPAELRDLPEGIRDEATAFLWTKTELQNDDHVTQSGTEYRVLKTSDRSEIGHYYRAVVGRVNDNH